MVFGSRECIGLRNMTVSLTSTVVCYRGCPLLGGSVVGGSTVRMVTQHNQEILLCIPDRLLHESM